MLHEIGVTLSRDAFEKGRKLLVQRLGQMAPQEIDNNAFGVFFRSFITPWLAESATAAARWVMNSQPHHFYWVLDEVAQAFRKDPGAFSAFIAEQGGAPQAGSLRTLMLAQTQPQAFLNAFAAGALDMKRLMPTMVLESALQQLAQQTGEKTSPQQTRQTVDQVLAVAARATDADARRILLCFVAQAAANAQPPLTVSELEAAFAPLSAGERGMAWTAYAESIQHSAPREAMELLRNLGANNPQHFTARAQNILQSWARNDPVAATEYFNAHSAMLDAGIASRAIARGWAQKDADAALAWADSFTDPALRGQTVRGVVHGMKEPEHALDVLLARSDLPGMYEEIYKVAGRWAGTDPAAAAQWLQTVEAGEERVKLAQSIAQQWALRDPETAWTFAQRENAPLNADMAYWLAKSYATSGKQNDAFWQAAESADSRVDMSAKAGMLTEMYRRNPASAEAWLQKQEARGDGAYAAVIALNVFTRDTNMVLDQPAAMAHTLSRYESRGQLTAAAALGAPVDMAVWRLPQYWVMTDPNAAVQWSLSLRNETLRNQAIKGIYDRTGGKAPVGYPGLFQGRDFAGKGMGPLK